MSPILGQIFQITGSGLVDFALWVHGSQEHGDKPPCHARLRRGAKLRHLRGVLGCFLSLVRAARSNGAKFGMFVDDFCSGRCKLIPSTRGDLVPIPPIDDMSIGAFLAAAEPCGRRLTELVNRTLAALDYLYGAFCPVCIPRRSSVAQHSAQRRLVLKWWTILRRAGAAISGRMLILGYALMSG